MTRKISLITAIVGAALVFAVPAFGDSWGADRQDEAVPVSPGLVDLIAKNGVVDSSVVEALTSSPDPSVYPDWFERAAAVAIQKHNLENMLNARERGLGVADNRPVITDPRHSSLVTRQKALAAQAKEPFDARSDGLNRLYGLGEYASPVVADDRFRIDHSNVPVQVSATSPGRDIEWPTVGIGFGIGIVLLLGLGLVMKTTHTRPFAH